MYFQFVRKINGIKYLPACSVVFFYSLFRSNVKHRVCWHRVKRFPGRNYMLCLSLSKKVKQYLLDLFGYNDWANLKLLETIQQLPDKEEAVLLFSHLITAQNKWINRITRHSEDQLLSWSAPVFALEELGNQWRESTDQWLELLRAEDEKSLQRQITFTRAADGKLMAVKLIDIVLQLNYHSIHHRAQINKLISKQGVTPPATDYIFTAIKEL